MNWFQDIPLKHKVAAVLFVGFVTTTFASQLNLLLGRESEVEAVHSDRERSHLHGGKKITYIFETSDGEKFVARGTGIALKHIKKGAQVTLLVDGLLWSTVRAVKTEERTIPLQDL